MRAKPSRHARFFYPVASSHPEFTRPIAYPESKFDWQRPWEQTPTAIKKDACALVWAHSRADSPSEPQDSNEFSDIFIKNQCCAAKPSAESAAPCVTNRDGAE
jgi:hypothetical protein